MKTFKNFLYERNLNADLNVMMIPTSYGFKRVKVPIGTNFTDTVAKRSGEISTSKQVPPNQSLGVGVGAAIDPVYTQDTTPKVKTPPLPKTRPSNSSVAAPVPRPRLDRYNPPLPKSRPHIASDDPPVPKPRLDRYNPPMPRPRPKADSVSTEPVKFQAVRPGVGTGGIEPSKKFKFATSVADAKWDTAPTPRDANFKSETDREDYIRTAAIRRNIDPSAALAVYGHEGKTGTGPTLQSKFPRKGTGAYGGREDSHGPFQLYRGGGLGNEFEKETGKSLHDPSSQKSSVDWALNWVAKNRTWNPWYGARAAFGKKLKTGLKNDPFAVPLPKDKK